MSVSSTIEVAAPEASFSREPPHIDFVVAGVQKGGTRALQHFLSQHPEIGLVSKPKIAPHFFDYDTYFEAHPDYAAYHSWYTGENLNRITGDITPIYIYWNPCIARIQAYNPHMKMIVLLRNPVDRAYSHWSMEFNRDNEADPFWKAILKEPFRRGFADQHRIYSYLHRGFYYQQIERLFTYFPREQCLIVKSEDLKQNHRSTLAQMLTFVGADPTIIPSPQEIHKGNYTPMPPAMRQALTLLYRRDIQRLQRLLDIDLSAWLSA